jgi:hypothetical protein
MSNLKDFISRDINPLGAIVEFADQPADGSYLPLGSLATKTLYPEFTLLFPNLYGWGTGTTLRLGTASDNPNEYVRVK